MSGLNVFRCLKTNKLKMDYYYGIGTVLQNVVFILENLAYYPQS